MKTNPQPALMNCSSENAITNFLPPRVRVTLFFVAVWLCLWPIGSFGQKPLKIKKEALGHGEYLQYTVSYHWGILWIDAGTVDFKAEGPTDSKSFWHFKSTGASLRRFDWLFRVRDTFEVSTMSNPFKPSQFRRNTFEGSKHTYNLYQFDYSKRQVFLITQENQKQQHFDTVDLKTPITDVLTATYITRSLDFSSLSSADTLVLPLLMDRKITKMPIVFLGNEERSTPSGKRFSCLKFSARPAEGTVFLANEPINVWVTDDDNRVPVLIEAKILVGSIQVHLTGYEKLAHPLKAYLGND